jgi:hypothetical protein
VGDAHAQAQREAAFPPARHELQDALAHRDTHPARSWGFGAGTGSSEQIIVPSAIERSSFSWGRSQASQVSASERRVP